MSNWQEWIALALVALCVLRMLYGFLQFFRRARKSQSPCDSCVSGCELKDMLDKKRQECVEAPKNKKKKCCG